MFNYKRLVLIIILLPVWNVGIGAGCSLFWEDIIILSMLSTFDLMVSIRKILKQKQQQQQQEEKNNTNKAKCCERHVMSQEKFDIGIPLAGAVVFHNTS